MITLPENYLKEMKDLLNEEFSEYLNSFQEKPHHGLRVNTSRISVEEFQRIAPFHLEAIPWTKDGFYYREEDRPAKHPFYYAGLYYLQEPSAMLPAEVLPVSENDRILDCCAAPGGKTFALANKLSGSGLILANDISVSRAQILLQTLERQGVRNACVMAEDISRLDCFEECFDSILIDAPCSGEGMFRKEPELIRSYKEKDSSCYVPIQKEILLAAGRMLKKGGTMVYSTCTFSLAENEEVVETVLKQMPELKVLPIDKQEGFVSGLTENTKGCVRLYPHRIRGEGHFVALMQKEGQKTESKPVFIRQTEFPEPFFQHIDPSFFQGKIVQREEKLYLEAEEYPDLSGLRILRSGIYLGKYKRERFEPSQALVHALRKDRFDTILDLKQDDPRTLKYLKCETLAVDEAIPEGYVLVCVEGYPLGFGILKNRQLKNRYPANSRYR